VLMRLLMKTPCEVGRVSVGDGRQVLSLANVVDEV
jgi:hypothetical protein